MNKILFEKSAVTKFTFTIIAFVIIFGIQIFIWFVLDPIFENANLEYMQFQTIVAIILALIFFLWNAGQIYFVKQSIDNTAIGREARFQLKTENKQKKAKKISKKPSKRFIQKDTS